MPSDRRLHPSAILFAAAGVVKRLWFALGFAAVDVGRGREFGWYVLVALLVGSLLYAVLRYATFRYRLADGELVVRSGILTRRERHIPFNRIQNLDAQHTPVHRMFGVVEVAIQTGGGDEPEATLGAINERDFDDMRRQIQHAPDAPTTAARDGAPPLVAMSLRDIALVGLVELRGIAVLAAVIGFAWELVGSYFDVRPRDAVRWLMAGFDASRMAVAISGLLVAIALLSVLWAIVRLHRFRAWQDGDSIRVEHGLVTRIVAAIPLRRIQSVTILEGPVHRALGRVAVEVETAGGSGADAQEQRSRLAPLLPAAELRALLANIVPEVSLDLAWQPLAPLAWRRIVKGSLVLAIAIAAASALIVESWALAVLAAGGMIAVVHARAYARHTRWAIDGAAFVFRDGWLWRRTTIVRRSKIQVVELGETPFDRRRTMASVSVDTAGATLAVPYLPEATAADLHERLAAGAASNAFRW